MERTADLLWDFDRLVRHGSRPAWGTFVANVPAGKERQTLLVDLFCIAAQHNNWDREWIKQALTEHPDFQDRQWRVRTARSLYRDQSACECASSWDAFSVFGLSADELCLRIEGEPLYLGARVGSRFLVKRRLAAGAFGIVYLAVGLGTNELVALKTPWCRPSSVAERNAALLREEAALLRAAQGPGVPQIFDVMVVEGIPVLVLEYVKGSNLGALCDAGRINTEEAIRIARCVANIVGRSHKQGHIHRDLKPDNVLLREDGMVVVVDFGIGLREETQFSDDATRAGTIRYMAPECIVQNVTAIDERADIWSLGVVLYEMLTGQELFENGTKESVWVESSVGFHLRKLEDAEIDDGIKPIIRECLAFDRRKRFMTMGALERALADWTIR